MGHVVFVTTLLELVIPPQHPYRRSLFYLNSGGYTRRCRREIEKGNGFRCTW